MAKKAKDLKPGDRSYNADTNEWEQKKDKTKPTPASNTRKKMKKAAASAPKPATKTKKAKETVAPVPATKKGKAPATGLIKLMDPASTPKGPKGRKGKKKPAFTKGGNAGDKTSKYEKMSSGGISLNVKRKPKAKLSK